MSTALHRRFTNYDFGFEIRPTLRLSRVMEIVKGSRIMDPPPTRRNLMHLLEEGVIEGNLTSYGWLVYEDSLLKWIRSINLPNAND